MRPDARRDSEGPPPQHDLPLHRCGQRVGVQEENVIRPLLADALDPRPIELDPDADAPGQVHLPTTRGVANKLERGVGSDPARHRTEAGEELTCDYRLFDMDSVEGEELMAYR